MTTDTVQAQQVEGSPRAEERAMVDTLFDVVEAWAAYGLKMGKVALEGAAQALTRTARALETIAQRLEEKEEEKKA